MKQTTGDFILKRIAQWGVRRIFGYPGDGINGLLGAMGRLDDGLRFIQVRHEEMASFMACAHAKFTGEVGVCMATSGPGAIHLLNGLYDAKLDHQPVVAIVGQAARAVLGSDYQQEVDLLSVFKDVAGEYVEMIAAPMAARHVIDRAFRTALGRRTVTCIIVPNDIPELEAVPAPPHEHNTVHSSIGIASTRALPASEDLERAAVILNEGERVALLVGAGALRATDEVVAVAQQLGAGIAKALLGKAAVPDDLPYVTGQTGLLGTAPSSKLLAECDTLLMVGTSFPYAEFLPKEGRARAIQIDIDARALGLRYATELNLVGDSKSTLAALLPLLEWKADRSWRDRIEGWVLDWKDLIASRAQVKADPLHPAFVFTELSKRLPDGCIITSDAGTAAMWYARYLQMREGMQASLSGGLASMGSAVPYAVAAKFAHPGRVAIATVGDGAMQMNGLNEMITIAKYWSEWEDPRLVILVLNNQDLNMVTWEMRALSGNPKYEPSQRLPDFPYAGYAQSIGLLGVRVDAPEKVPGALDAALASDRPCLVEAVTDPNVPLLPPHIDAKQAGAFLRSLAGGDPDRWKVARQSLREALAEVKGAR